MTDLPATDELSKATTTWLTLLEAQDEHAALQYFSTVIVPLILPTVRARFATVYPREAVEGHYQGLISLLGFTPDTTILATRFTGARMLAVIHTAETARFLDDVRAHCGLPADAVQAFPFHRDRLEDLSTAVDHALDWLGDRVPVAVEVTGGTKPMGIYAHGTAQSRGLDTLYIDYDQYEPRYRKPLPESLHFHLLRTPPPRRRPAATS